MVKLDKISIFSNGNTLKIQKKREKAKFLSFFVVKNYHYFFRCVIIFVLLDERKPRRVR